jgi:hypothetical protein
MKRVPHVAIIMSTIMIVRAAVAPLMAMPVVRPSTFPLESVREPRPVMSLGPAVLAMGVGDWAESAQTKAETQAEKAAFDETHARAERGDPEAQFELGLLYFGGHGVSRDDVQAVAWWRKAAARSGVNDSPSSHTPPVARHQSHRQSISGIRHGIRRCFV